MIKMVSRGNMKMSTKVFTIYPDTKKYCYAPFGYKLPSGEFQIIFSISKPRLSKKGHQTVTNCLIRQHLTVIGVGFTVENFNDERDELIGMQWAFKRAVQSIIKNIEFHNKKVNLSKRSKKQFDGAFRLALYKARNGGSK
jgi:hypothetical protein